MRRVIVDSSLLGTESHVVVDEEGFTSSQTVPRDAWHLTGVTKPSPRCADTLLALAGITLSTPPAAYVRGYTALAPNESPPWRLCLPRKVFREYFSSLVGGIRDRMGEYSWDYVEGPWHAGTRVLSALRPAKVDPEIVARHSADARDERTLSTFSPNRSGYAPVPRYDRFRTRTGRLVIAEGPEFLTLPRSCRDVVRSSFEGGSVVSLDFRALEARIVLAEAGRSAPTGDLYDDIARHVLGGESTRDSVKTAVISELYGASTSSLGRRLGIGGRRLDEFVSVVREHFGVASLRARLEEESRGTHVIRNRFGRQLRMPEDQDGLLVNTYAQSTGVDVSLMGFDSILKTLGTDGVRPLAVLHDALILDVRPDRMSDVAAVESVSVDTYTDPFPVKVSPFFDS